MKSIIVILILITTTATAWAGGEEHYAEPFRDGSCGEESESGQLFVKPNGSCQFRIYEYADYENKVQSRYWLEFRPIGKRTYRRVTRIRTFVDKNRDYQETLKLPFQGTGYYRIVFDTNNNGFPDYTGRDVLLFQKK